MVYHWEMHPRWKQCSQAFSCNARAPAGMVSWQIVQSTSALTSVYLEFCKSCCSRKRCTTESSAFS